MCCGEIIPEGRQICPNCENVKEYKRKDMQDIDTVIKSLEICTGPGTKGCSNNTGECPYLRNGCRGNMEADALVLLKALSGQNAEAEMEDMERHDGFMRWRNA